MCAKGDIISNKRLPIYLSGEPLSCPLGNHKKDVAICNLRRTKFFDCRQSGIAARTLYRLIHDGLSIRRDEIGHGEVALLDETGKMLDDGLGGKSPLRDYGCNVLALTIQAQGYVECGLLRLFRLLWCRLFLGLARTLGFPCAVAEGIEYCQLLGVEIFRNTETVIGNIPKL